MVKEEMGISEEERTIEAVSHDVFMKESMALVQVEMLAHIF